MPGGIIELNLSWIPLNPDKWFFDIVFIKKARLIISNLIHTPIRLDY
jgi:hypothetical protein